ncbi:MAG TPA: DUF502 domain-containing protein [Candidatus Eisenbacteria bacterium]|nr:DUF502 domain-containing protein [Candidatus Eisenbacteria bacterium]
MSDTHLPLPIEPVEPLGFWARMRAYLLGGLLVLGPTALSVWVLWRLFVWIDGLLGKYLRFSWLEYRQIPGLGLIAMLILLLVSGWMASLFAGFTLVRAWDRALARLPLFRVIYNPAKQLGEAFLSGKRTVFHQVVLVQWPHAEAWAIAFLTAPPPRSLAGRLDGDMVGVFVPSTPNPTAGHYHLMKRERVIAVDLTVEQGIQLIVSGGVVRPEDSESVRTLPSSSS